MTTVAFTGLGCVIVGEDCLTHGKGELGYGEVMCSHSCSEAEGWFEHSLVCDDPPPPARAARYASPCIACGRTIAEGELVRRYEEGNVCADGCPEGAQPS